MVVFVMKSKQPNSNSNCPFFHIVQGNLHSRFFRSCLPSKKLLLSDDSKIFCSCGIEIRNLQVYLQLYIIISNVTPNLSLLCVDNHFLPREMNLGVPLVFPVKVSMAQSKQTTLQRARTGPENQSYGPGLEVQILHRELGADPNSPL